MTLVLLVTTMFGASLAAILTVVSLGFAFYCLRDMYKNNGNHDAQQTPHEESRNCGR